MIPARRPAGLVLESCGDGETEGLAGLAQGVVGAEGIDGLPVSEVAGFVITLTVLEIQWIRTGEHRAGDGYRRSRAAVEAQRVISPVDAEGRINDRQHNLQFQSG